MNIHQPSGEPCMVSATSVKPPLSAREFPLSPVHTYVRFSPLISLLPFSTSSGPPRLPVIFLLQKEMEKMQNHGQTSKKAIWDCDSALYDSFELKSFNRQLDSAIAARSYSMPHLSDPALQPTTAASPRKPSRISKSINRLLRALLRMKPGSGARSRWYAADMQGVGQYGHRANYGALTTIPEACEKEAAGSPELRSVLGKSASQRFPATAVAAARISCP